MSPMNADKTFTFGLIKSKTVEKYDIFDILSHIKPRLTLEFLRRLELPKSLAERFYEEHKGESYFAGAVNSITCGPVYVVILSKSIYNKENKFVSATLEWRDIIGHRDPKQRSPDSLRSKYGFDNPHNGFHGSDSYEAFLRESTIFLSK